LGVVPKAARTLARRTLVEFYQRLAVERRVKFNVHAEYAIRLAAEHSAHRQ